MPQASHQSDPFAAWERDLIRREVRAFIAKALTFSWDDEDDLINEAQLRWWQVRTGHRGDRGANPQTFLKRVVRHRLEEIARAERAQRRGGGERLLSLDEEIFEGGDDEATRASLVEDWAEGPEGIAISGAALESALARLSPRQMRIVGASVAGYRRTEAARQVQISRDTLYTELGRIRDVFGQTGLGGDRDPTDREQNS